MTSPKPTRPTKAQREAAIWAGRLKKLRITNAELREFWKWRQVPGHRAAWDNLVGVARD